jgi:hypothetical protein
MKYLIGLYEAAQPSPSAPRELWQPIWTIACTDLPLLSEVQRAIVVTPQQATDALAMLHHESVSRAAALAWFRAWRESSRLRPPLYLDFCGLSNPSVSDMLPIAGDPGLLRIAGALVTGDGCTPFGSGFSGVIGDDMPEGLSGGQILWRELFGRAMTPNWAGGLVDAIAPLGRFNFAQLEGRLDPGGVNLAAVDVPSGPRNVNKGRVIGVDPALIGLSDVPSSLFLPAVFEPVGPAKEPVETLLKDFAIATAAQVELVVAVLYFLSVSGVEVVQSPVSPGQRRRARDAGEVRIPEFVRLRPTRVVRSPRPEAAAPASARSEPDVRVIRPAFYRHFADNACTHPHVRCDDCLGKKELEGAPCQRCSATGLDPDKLTREPCLRVDGNRQPTCPNGCRREYVPEKEIGPDDAPLLPRVYKALRGRGASRGRQRRRLERGGGVPVPRTPPRQMKSGRRSDEMERPGNGDRGRDRGCQRGDWQQLERRRTLRAGFVGAIFLDGEPAAVLKMIPWQSPREPESIAAGTRAAVAALRSVCGPAPHPIEARGSVGLSIAYLRYVQPGAGELYVLTLDGTRALCWLTSPNGPEHDNEVLIDLAVLDSAAALAGDCPDRSDHESHAACAQIRRDRWGRIFGRPRRSWTGSATGLPPTMVAPR